ncbi:hypothetical protein M5362_25200 [Streptomyces sp. Je 1-79]|uniref:hypothetical protein n=1 Tax=Streptomyces sp. Je 1-79 TaxID=2943847 RepID=UPI0021A271BD|nr:hypothetical protein [Streptomyces sp. Je 1-79]MCT4356430.1 hypothetical protein [Streptomyces sp. Je 1-79]
MAPTTYNDAMTEALERLRPLGYEHGSRALVNHAPMAAEALAYMGYTDEVSRWLDRTVRARDYHEAPVARFALSPDDPSDWRSALGDFGRVGDWTALFARQLEDEPWRDVLARWWPRLMPGVLAVMGHGVIRTAHAVRAVARAGEDNRLQLGELAHGLGYWAARHEPVPGAAEAFAAATGRAAGGPDDAAAAVRALDDLTAESAGIYTEAHQHHPVPLIHAVTTPAAVRLVCAYVPSDQHRPSYLATAEATRTMRSWFVKGPVSAHPAPRPDTPPARELFATAAEIGDEHAIKLAEVAVRHGEQAPDHRYAAAAHTANRAIDRILR